MPIISVIDNENNGWRRNAEKQTNKKTNKGWELNDFVVHSS